MHITLKYWVLLVCLVSSGGVLAILEPIRAAGSENDIQGVFEYNYQRWKEHCKQVEFSSKSSDRVDSPYYNAIVKLGPRALPYIIEKRRQDKDFHWISWACTEIAGVIRDPSINPWAKESMLSWWEGGQGQANERFELLYGKWKRVRAQGAFEEADKVSRSIRALGIAVLPRMIEKLRLGDADPVLMIRALTAGAADTSGGTPADQAQACVLWWEKNKGKWIIPFEDNKQDVSVRGTFEKKYIAWQEYRKRPDIRRSSNPKPHIENEPYREMVRLGIGVLPYMMEKVEKDRDVGGAFLCEAVSEISRTKFHITRSGRKPGEFRWTVEEFPDMKDMRPLPPRYQLWLRWWDEGRKQTPERFENLCKEWKALRGEGKEEEAWEKYQRIRDLGIVALPCIMEKVAAGERWLIPALSYLTDNAVKPYAEPDECAAWWKQNHADWTIPAEATPEAEGK